MREFHCGTFRRHRYADFCVLLAAATLVMHEAEVERSTIYDVTGTKRPTEATFRQEPFAVAFIAPETSCI